MTKMKLTVKGLSLLLCLGFLVSANNALAKTSLEDITNNKAYNDCADAKRYVSEYQRLDNCERESQEVSGLDSELAALCASAPKKEKETCRAGGKLSSEETLEKLNKLTEEQKATMQSRMQNAAKLSEQLKKANLSLSTCQSSLKSFLDKAKSAVNACEKAQKAADKADKKADKAQAAEDKAKQAYEEAEKEYDNCVASKGADNCSKELNNLSKAADKYNKKSEKAQTALDNATTANAAVGQNSCPSGLEWDGSECVDRAAQARALQQAQQEAANAAATNSQTAYNKCVAEKGADACSAEEAAMSKALEAAAALGDGTSINSSVDKSIQAEAQAAAGGYKTTCEKELSTMDGLFNYLACRITILVADLRVIVYILAGFGMIAFAYGAIIGKINFKQLANIGIGLFILSMTTSAIEYIAFDGKQELKFRDYLPDGNHAQFDVVHQNCDNNPSLCPDAQLAGLKADAENSKWSLSDLKNTIKSVKDGIKTASDAYSTVKSTVKTVATAADNIGNAIANGDNIIDSVTTIASNLGNAVNTINNSTNIVANSASRIAGDVQDAGSSAAQREYREELRNQYNNLSQRCALGNCSAAEQQSLANLQQQMNENTTGVDNFLATTGGDILNGLQNATNIATTGAEVGRAVNQAQIEGNAIGDNIGGGALGDILGATYAATEGYTSGSDAINNLQENGSFDFSSEKTKCENQGQPYAWQNNTCVDTCQAKTTNKEVFAWDKNKQACINKTQANCEARSTANRTYKWNTSTKKCEEVTSK